MLLNKGISTLMVAIWWDLVTISCSQPSNQLTGQGQALTSAGLKAANHAQIKWSIGRNIPITDNGSITGHVVAIIGLSILYVGLTFCYQEQHYCVKVEPCTFYQNNWQCISGQSAIFLLRCPACISDALFTFYKPTSANAVSVFTPWTYVWIQLFSLY